MFWIRWIKLFMMAFSLAAGGLSTAFAQDLCGHVIYTSRESGRIFAEFDGCEPLLYDQVEILDQDSRLHRALVVDMNRFYVVLQRHPGINQNVERFVTAGSEIVRSEHAVHFVINQQTQWHDEHDLIRDYVNLLKKYRKLSNDMITMWSYLSHVSDHSILNDYETLYTTPMTTPLNTSNDR